MKIHPKHTSEQKETFEDSLRQAYFNDGFYTGAFLSLLIGAIVIVALLDIFTDY